MSAKKRGLALFLAAGMAVMSVGCGSQAADSGKDPAEKGSETVTISSDEVPLDSKPVLSHTLSPAASGTTVYQNEKVQSDASHLDQGYVMVKYLVNDKKIKVQITKAGGTTYTYNLNSRGVYETFPLTEGNGGYTINVYENVTGNKYALAFGQKVSVSLTNSFLPFLYPNQYVLFNDNTQAVKVAAQLAAQQADDLGTVKSVYNYVVSNVTYDQAKASSVQSGYLPNVDTVLASKKGICFDYAALMTAMLRSQNIPTKMVIGYSGSAYHAWINVYTPETGWIDNVIYFDGKDWKLMDPTFAAGSKGNPEVLKYIGDGANYKAKYTY